MATEGSGGTQAIFEWSLELDASESEAQHTVERIRAAGGQAEVVAPPAAIAPLAIPLIIFGVVAIAGLAEQVWDWWRNRNKHGLLLHVGADGKLDIKEINIPYGKVIVITPDGTKTQHEDVSDNQKLKVLMESAAKAVTGSQGSGATPST